MLWSLRWTLVTRNEIEDGQQDSQDPIPLCQITSTLQWYPGSCPWSLSVAVRNGRGSRAVPTLVLSISSLNLLMNPLLHFPLQDPGSRRFVEVGDLEDMCGIDPVIRPPPHHLVAIGDEFVHRNLGNVRQCTDWMVLGMLDDVHYCRWQREPH